MLNGHYDCDNNKTEKVFKNTHAKTKIDWIEKLKLMMIAIQCFLFGSVNLFLSKVYKNSIFWSKSNSILVSDFTLSPN